MCHTVVFVCLCKVMYVRCCIQDNVDGVYVQDGVCNDEDVRM